MNSYRLLLLLGAIGLGFLTAWTLPSEFFLWALQVGIGATILLAIISSIDAKVQVPINPVAKVLSYFLLGTSRPTAPIKPTWPSLLFQVCAAVVVGMLVGMLWVGHTA